MLAALELEPLRIGEQRTGLHTQQRVVGLVVVLMGVVAVVRGEQRRLDLLGDLEQLRIRLALRRDAVVLDLDEEVVPPEDVLEASRLLECSLARRR